MKAATGIDLGAVIQGQALGRGMAAGMHPSPVDGEAKVTGA